MYNYIYSKHFKNILIIIGVMILLLGLANASGLLDSQEEKLKRLIHENDLVRTRINSGTKLRIEEIDSKIKALSYEKRIKDKCIQINIKAMGEAKTPVDCDKMYKDSLNKEEEFIKIVEDKSKKDFFIKGGQENPPLSGTNIRERINDLLIKYGRGEDVKHKRWERVSKKYKIKPGVLVCIAKADSSLGRELKTKNNFGNVGNTDTGRVRHYASPIAGIDAIGRVLTNKYLGKIQTIAELSCGGKITFLGYNHCKQDGKLVYATSSYNHYRNVVNCMRNIYNDNSIDGNFKIRE